jgi:hypothetical protein
MNITVFKEVTTEGVIKAFEDDAVLYEDLYVDMKEAEQRKFVKDNGQAITGLRKSLNTSRIALTKKAKLDIDKEFKSIDDRLAKANEPFTLLIDAHNAERKIELDNEKDRLKLIDDLAQKEVDHEFALLLNKTYEQDEAMRVYEQEMHDEEVAKEAVLLEKARAEFEVARAEMIENDRQSDIQHVRNTKMAILESMILVGLDREKSIDFINIIDNKELSQLTINY